MCVVRGCDWGLFKGVIARNIKGGSIGVEILCVEIIRLHVKTLRVLVLGDGG